MTDDDLADYYRDLAKHGEGPWAKKPIKTDHVHGPMAHRDDDWAAWRDGAVDGDPVGRGRTEEAAIKELKFLEEERENIV